MKLTWYSPAGVEIEFSSTSETYRLLRSVDGLSNPPGAPITRKAPYQDGSKLIDYRYEDREISFDVMIMASGREDLEYAKRILTTSLNALPGAGSLVITQEDGSEYVIYCVGAGSTPQYSTSVHGDKYQLATIDLIAPDPFIYSYPSEKVYFGSGTPVVFPYVFPWMFPASTPSQSRTNEGSVSVGVTIIVSGAITNPSISRSWTDANGVVTTETIAFTLTMTAGEVLTITTGPGNKTITLKHDDGTYDTNPFQYLDSGYVFWQMVPGENTFTVASSAISDGTQTSIEYASKFSGL